jgi:O-antigen ligase
MRELLFIDDTPANKISYYLLLVFLISLPFDMLYSELALAGLVVHTLIHAFPGGGRRGDGSGGLLPARWAGWWIAVIFGLSLAGMLYAPGLRDAWKECEKQLAILLFPLIAWFSRLDWAAYKMRLLKAFSFSCLFTSLYLFGVVLHTLYRERMPISAFYAENFINHPFTHPIGLHATYYAMYMSISMVVFVYEATSYELRAASRQDAPRRVAWGRAGYIAAAFVCLAAILQLAARAVCIADVLVLTVVLPWSLGLRGRKFRYFVLGLAVLCGIAAITVMRQNALHDRYMVQFKNDLQSSTGREGDPEPRMARWACAWELIKQSPVIGYGTGAEPDLLKERYFAHNLMIAWLHNLNAHNQYLSFLLGTGIFGLVAYLILLGLGFRVAYRRKDLFFASFLLLVCAVSLSENILDVNKGIFFFSFFFALFFYRPSSPAGAAGTAGCAGRPGGLTGGSTLRFFRSYRWPWLRKKKGPDEAV